MSALPSSPRFAVLFGASLCALLAACSQRDPLEEAAWQASRHGTAAGEGRDGRDTRGLEVGAAITERFYFVAKYEATRAQRQVAQAAAARVAPRVAATAKKRGRQAPRYIAVKTRSDARAQTKTSVMVWDTQSRAIVGNNVYDLNEAPPSGATIKFETHSAQFVDIAGT